MARIPIMQPWLGVEESRAVAEAMASGWIAQGPRVTAFEEGFAARVGARYGVATSSCTAGLHLAMVVLGIRPGDEVIVPSLSFIATANAPTFVGARPVFADVDEATLALTPETVEPHITPRTRAVIVAHQAGIPADLDPLRALCASFDLALVEDAACAVGSSYRGAPIGAHAELAVFSFHPRKLLTTGEGGMIVTSSDEHVEQLRRLRSHGMSVSDVARHTSDVPVFERYAERGFNYRMTDVAAAIGLVQLRKLDAMLERRRLLADRYRAALADQPFRAVAGDPPHGTSNDQSFWVALDPGAPVSRDEVIARLFRAGVGARRGIMAAHLEPLYAGFAAPGTLPVTERLAATTLILPLFHELASGEQDHVVEVLRAAQRPAVAPIRRGAR